MKKITLALLACMLAGSAAYTQSIRTKDNRLAPVYLSFKEDAARRSPEQLLQYLRSKYGIGSEMSFVLKTTTSDNIGLTHQRYRQLCNGHVVEGAELVLHLRNNQVESCSGDLFPVASPDTRPAVTEQAALNAALDLFHAETYIWQSNAFRNNPARQLPKGELVWAPEKGNAKSGRFVLAYKFDIYALKPLKKALVYVDATDGHILWVRNTLMDFHARGTAYTKYSGMRPLMTDSLAPNNYTLGDDTRSITIHNMMNTVTDDYPFYNTTNLWADTVGNDGAEYDVHWGLQHVYDYYDSTHSRMSFDGLGSPIDAYVHYDVDYANAFWDGQELVFGDGDLAYNMRPLASLEIVGHELTHGVTQYTANLDYSDEPGALNESFSDIFGKTIEHRYKPTTFTWMIGHEIATNGGFMRSMSDPKQANDPDTYYGQNWYMGSDDEGGVHTNSGVQNHWFYILSMGKSGVNDLSNSYAVTGIGIDKAAAIAYRSLSYYLTSFSGYQDAAYYSMLAAEELYGSCSNEAVQTANAWYAVGVNTQQVQQVKATAAAMPASIHRNEYIQLQSTSLNATAGIQWLKDGVAFSTNTNDSCTFTTSGAHQIQLIASGNVCSDTLVQAIQVLPGLSVPGMNTQPLFTVYPNPANGYFLLSGTSSSAKGINYTLTDVSGKVVAGRTIADRTSYQENISVRHLANGIYHLTVTDNGQVNTVQIMVRN